jgi:hypothetical protein
VELKNDLDPKLIGTVVSLQTFRRVADNSDKLVNESLEKYVGKLIGYAVTPTSNTFVFEGMGPLTIVLKTHYFEIFMA